MANPSLPNMKEAIREARYGKVSGKERGEEG